MIGAGPGIGAAVARRLCRGLDVGVIARSRATLDSTLTGLTGERSLGRTADVTDEAGLRDALDSLVDRLGVPRVLVYNAALIQSDRVGELSAQGQLDAYAVNVVGAITAITHLAPRMGEAGGGTVILTGGMPEPIPEVTSLSLGQGRCPRAHRDPREGLRPTRSACRNGDSCGRSRTRRCLRSG